MRETFYILQEVQQRRLMLSLEMIGFVRKGNDKLKAYFTTWHKKCTHFLLRYGAAVAYETPLEQ